MKFGLRIRAARLAKGLKIRLGKVPNLEFREDLREVIVKDINNPTPDEDVSVNFPTCVGETSECTSRDQAETPT